MRSRSHSLLFVSCAIVLLLSSAPAQQPAEANAPTGASAAPSAQQTPYESTLEQIKKCVVFLKGDYSRIEKDKDGTGRSVGHFLQGTGFLIKRELSDGNAIVYLVTNKHMVREPGPNDELGKGPYFPTMQVRVNLKKENPDGTKFATVSFAGDSGNGLEWLTDEDDPQADLAIIPMGLDFNIYDSETVPTSLFATKPFLLQKHVDENDEVLFTGLFASFPGVKQNYPIVRHGKLAALAAERIPLDPRVPDVTTDLHLVEVTSWGGNSGSPVFLRFGLRDADIRPGALLLGGNSTYYLVNIPRQSRGL